MKTSNKLLLGSAVLLIIIPMIVMAINVKMNYVNATSKSYLSRQELNEEPFNKQTIGRLAIPISTPFISVNFADLKMMSTEIHLLKSESYGVKIPDYAKENFNFRVDENGVLNIVIKNDTNYSPNDMSIVIYSPTFKKLDITNANSIQLSAISDSLQVNLKNADAFSFSGAITYNNDKGDIYKTINQTEIKYLSLNLTNSNFNSYGKSFQVLVITSNGYCTIGLSGDETQKEKYSINNLVINTSDTAEVLINNIMIKNCSGKVSDHTKLEMPVVNLKQLFKN